MRPVPVCTHGCCLAFPLLSRPEENTLNIIRSARLAALGRYVDGMAALAFLRLCTC